MMTSAADRENPLFWREFLIIDMLYASIFSEGDAVSLSLEMSVDCPPEVVREDSLSASS